MLELRINGLQPSKVKQMLEFIYSDKVKEEGDLDLLRLAEKFQIRGLIKRCGRSLATTVNLDNAFDLLDAVSSQPDGPLKYLKLRLGAALLRRQLLGAEEEICSESKRVRLWPHV